MTQATTPGWVRSLARVYPRDRLLTRPAELAPYESDALTAFRARPAAVVIPLTQEEVVATVRLCHHEEVPFVAPPYGLYFAPDPSSQPVCTIGGNIAFNSGGAHCLKYGMTANHVLGLTVVLADGEMVRIGGESLETVGPDLVGVFVGSEGLFGIALEITLRLLPRPEVYRTLLAAYQSLEVAGDAVAQVVAAGVLPGAIHIMDRLAIH